MNISFFLGNESTQMEKRLRKITDTIIGHTMIECGGMLGKIRSKPPEHVT